MKYTSISFGFAVCCTGMIWEWTHSIPAAVAVFAFLMFLYTLANFLAKELR